MAKTSRKQASKRHHGGTLFVVLLSLAVFTITILYIATGSVLQEKGQILSSLKQDMTAMQEENRRLAVEIAEVTAPANLEFAAIELGMVKGEQEDYMYYVPSEKEGALTVAEDESEGSAPKQPEREEVDSGERDVHRLLNIVGEVVGERGVR